jgi:hypothetical protein
VSFTAGLGITVSDAAPASVPVWPTTSVTATLGTVTLTANGGGILVTTNAPVTAGTDVVFLATGPITVTTSSNVTAENGSVTWIAGCTTPALGCVPGTGSSSISLSSSSNVLAAHNVTFLAGGAITATTSLSVTATSGDVLWHAYGGNITSEHNVTVTAGGNVTFTASGAITIDDNSPVTAQTGNVTFTASGGDITLERTVAVTANVNVTFTAVTGSIDVGAPYTVFLPGAAGACTATACNLNPYETPGETTSAAAVTATTGLVLWQADLNVTQSSLSTTTASTGITIEGDYRGLDLAGTVITLAGTLSVTTPWTSGSADLIQVFGNSHDDQFIFQQTQLNGRARVYGSNTPTPASTTSNPNAFAPEGDGNDTFTVNELQPMNNISTGATLTLDGQSGNNTYNVFTWGSQSQSFAGAGDVINVLGTGAPTTGSQTLNIYGNDNGANDGVDPTTGLPYATNDIFLLRSVPSIDFETASQPQLYTDSAQQTAGEAFVAVLHTLLSTAQNVDSSGNALTSPTASFPVERVNYSSALNGGVHVFGVGGNDYFASDDNAAPTYLTGGPGDTTFQIGQIYGLRRTTDSSAGNLASENTFDVATIATTRGWVSRGNSAPLVAQGGCGFDASTSTCRAGNDTFIVYSNQAPIHLEGDGGNNLFVVRGFALAQTDPATGNILLPGGCSAIAAPNCTPLPQLTNGFSTSAETDVRTGAGNNQVEYAMSAPVSVDGGLGFNKLVILGTEFADHIVVTDHGIFGAGMSVTYRNVQVIEIDALQGDDTIDVLSTAPGTAVRVVGGDGSNQINVAGDVNGNVYSQDINGTSSVVNHQISSADLTYDNLVVSGVSVNVAQPSQGAVIITQNAGGTVVAESGSGQLGTMSSFGVHLASAPTGTVYVRLTAEGDTLEQQSLGGDSIVMAVGQNLSAASFFQVLFHGSTIEVPQRSVVLVFTAANYNVDQFVSVAAINDAGVDSYPGTRVYEISPSVLSADTTYNNAEVGMVDVTKIDNSLPAIDVTSLGNTNGPGIYADGGANGTTTFTSQSAVFTMSDVGQPIVELDNRGLIPVGTMIAAWVSATTVLLSAPVTSATGIQFALPGRNVSTTVLGGTGTGIAAYYEVSLSTAPTGTVTVGINPSDGRISLSSLGGRLTGIGPVGSTPGAYQVTFDASNWNIPVIIKVTAAQEMAPSDPNNTYVTSQVIGGTAGEYAGVTTAIPQDFLVLDDNTPGVVVQAPGSSLTVVKCGNPACTLPGAGASYTLRLTMAPTANVDIALIGDGQTMIASSAIGTQIFYKAIGSGTKGLYTGSVAFNPTLGTLTRTDGSSWLDSGFLEGQLIQITGYSQLYKIESLTGPGVSVLTVTPATINPTTGVETAGLLPLSGPQTNVTVTEWAPVVRFTPSNWMTPVTVPLLADPYYSVGAGNAQLLEFPKQPHLLSNIRGPLSVEGGSATVDYSVLQPAVMLPGEKNAAPFGLANQPPEAQQVNTLNIFDDGSLQDQTGTLSSSVLTGLGMPSGILDFSTHNGYCQPVGSSGCLNKPTFGEPSKFLYGITFGSTPTDPSTGQLVANAGLSTIQVLNLMLGQGNDHLTVTGSLVPGPYANGTSTCTTLVNNVCVAYNAYVQGGLTQVQGGGAAYLSVSGSFTISGTAGVYSVTRADGLNWGDYEFAIGQELLWNGVPFGTITAVSGATLTVAGGSTPPAGGSGTIAVFAPQVSSAASFTIAPATGSSYTISRDDSRSWSELGFAIGQSLTIDGIPVGQITGISGPNVCGATQNQPCGYVLTVGATMPSFLTNGTHTVAVYNPAGPNPVMLGGNDITITGGGGPGPGLQPPIFNGPVTYTGNTISRNSGSWLTDGFVDGMVVQINGSPAWTVTGVTATTLTLSGPALVSSIFTATNTSVVGWAPSPLVVYGSTSQDGIWYSGSSSGMTQRDFGSKPFPNQLGNGTPDFIFPVAASFKHAGNNVVDASRDFIGVPEGQLPSVGVIIYGGPGNNTIYGSQASDYIAAGSGNDTISGERGDNLILGTDGVNVNVITRAINFPTVNASLYPNADPLIAGNNLIYGNTAGVGPTATDPYAGETTTDGYGDFNNVIFGAMGIVTQATQQAIVGALPGSSHSMTANLTSGPGGQAVLTWVSGSQFTLNDVGLVVFDPNNTNLSAGTTIAVFVDATHVLLSREPAHSNVNGLSVTVGPAYGYCRPGGTEPSSTLCPAAALNAFGHTPLEQLQTTGDILTISSTQPQNHGNATIYGSGGDNVIIGGDGNNNIQGGPGRNLIIGGSALLDRSAIVSAGTTYYNNPRFQDLLSQTCSGTAMTEMYNTCTTGTTPLGQAMTDGKPQSDPTGLAGTVALPKNLYGVANGMGAGAGAVGWWADFLSASSTGKVGITLSVPANCGLGSGVSGCAVPAYLQDSALKGVDYIAGGSGDAMIFGESNNNIIQAHGSIDLVDPATARLAAATGAAASTSGDPYAGAATCMFRGYYLGDRVGACRTAYGDPLPVDPTQPLEINPSLDNGGVEYSATGSFAFGTLVGGVSTVTRSGTMSWADLGFAVGQTVAVLSNGVFTEVGVVTTVTPTVLTLTGLATAVPGCTAASCTLSVTDGQSYVEGGRGNNTIFANQGQNDIIGGNSSMYSLGLTQERASGSNLIFGGSGDNVGYEDCTNATFDTLNASNVCVTSADGHAHDANVIVANNGNVVSLVGVNGTYGFVTNGITKSPIGYLQYAYDVQGNPTATEWIIPRAVTLLDYTPGGPDLAGTPGPLAAGDIGGTPVPGCTPGTVAQQVAGTGAICQQQGSEIHVESGDAFVYGGPANDVVFGGAQNDSIILGYGDNWVSGGRGDQCIIGGGGRCLTSRVSPTYGEPLYGIGSISTATPAGQLISTPGNAQEADINVSGALKYTALLYPYNWDPASKGLTGQAAATFSGGVPYQPRFGHNIIYGGWGNGVIHGGPGQSAISGADAPMGIDAGSVGYTDNFNMKGSPIGAPVESDWSHPFNPGNPMGFNTATSELSYFNTANPRQQIFVSTNPASGVDCAGPASTTCRPWFLDANYNPETDAAMPLDTTWYQSATTLGICPAGACLQEPVTGDKAIFGDLGNDWIVGGMGRVRVYGGWGNDVIDLRALTNIDGGLNDMPVPDLAGGPGSYALPTTTNPVYGTPAWAGLSFGGGGQDIQFAGTGGDRLIDWTGQHNSDYVPFSNFGMPTISRTLMPFLPQFLYALSASDGADPTLGQRYSGDPTRNGEPFGELGLVLQHDAAWHDQTGSPFNKMPENLGGTPNDIAVHNPTQPLYAQGMLPVSIGAATLALPNGTGVALPSGTNPASATAVPVLITGTPGSSVTYTFTEAGGYRASGSGVIGSDGRLATTVDLSLFPDGTISVTAVLTDAHGKITTITQTMGKNSVAPPAPTVTAAAYDNLAGQTSYRVTVTGQVGSIANIVITENGVAVPNLVNGMDSILANGSLIMTFDTSFLLDGNVTVSVTLTNGAGNSTATTLTILKDTAPPAVSISAPPYINSANAGAYQVVVSGEPGATIGYVITDSAGNTISNAKGGTIPASGKWNANMNLAKFVNGAVTLTVTETDPAGNPTVSTTNLMKMVQTVATPTVSLNTASDSGSSSSDYITNVNAPQFTAKSTTAGATTAVYVNGVLYAGQKLADGKYTVTAVASDQYGNVSATGTALKTLVIVTVPPTGSWAISGAVVVGGVPSTSSKTPTLSLSFSDLGGIYQMSTSTNNGLTWSAAVAYAATTTISLSAGDGSYTVIVKLTDAAGNVGTYTQTVRLDTTGPTISASLSAPQATIGYDGSADITISSGATDVSGVSSVTVKLDGTTTVTGGVIDIDTLMAGTHTLVVTAVDGLGNTSSVTLTFQIHPSLAGIKNAVAEGTKSGLITTTEQAKLLSILGSTATKTSLTNFINEVKAASKAIASREASILTSWAQDLYARS